eukprot:TCONS_00045922-protein
MSGCKHPFTNCALLLLLFLVYTVYPIPFITTHHFMLSQDFLIIDTCGGAVFMLTALLGNLLCLLVFKDIENKAKLIYILMFIVDTVQPFFTLPVKINAHWEIYHKRTDVDTHYEDIVKQYQHLLNAFNSVWYAFVVLSLLFFTLICILDFYVAAKQIKRERITSSVKYTALTLVVFTAALLSYLYFYIHDSNKWTKIIALCVVSFYIPITVSTICLVLSSLIRTFLNVPLLEDTEHSKSPSNKFIWMLWLAYLICYLPFYILISRENENHPEKIHAIYGLVLMKSCCNIFLLIEFDCNSKEKLKLKLYKISTKMAELFCKNCCCCCGKIGDCISAGRNRLIEILETRNHFVVVETPSGVTLQNGNFTTRSTLSSISSV